MELGKIEKLLESYDEGVTSLDEEKILRDYFLKNEVPEHLESYKMMFLFSVKQAGQTFEKPVKIRKPGYNWYAWSSIAAIFIIAMGVLIFQDDNSPEQKDLGTISDKELALEKTKETLNMISQIMNEGKSDLVYLKEFNNTKDKIIQID